MPYRSSCPTWSPLCTLEPKSQDGDKVVFDRYSKQIGELPLFLVDVKYEDNASVAGKWTQAERDEGKGKTWTEDKGLGEFSGRAISQAEFTSSNPCPRSTSSEE